jgi:hypothetical protein
MIDRDIHRLRFIGARPGYFDVDIMLKDGSLSAILPFLEYIK